MTPEWLTGLEELLIAFRDWLAEDVGDTVEQQTIGYLVDVIAFQRRRLLAEGAG